MEFIRQSNVYTVILSRAHCEKRTRIDICFAHEISISIDIEKKHTTEITRHSWIP